VDTKPFLPPSCPLRRSRRARHERGYSLPELLVVLGILGVSTTIGVYVANTSGWRTSAAASDVARHLELARSQAAFNDFEVRIVFDPAGGSFRVHLDRNSDGDLDTNIGETETRYVLSASAEHVLFGCPTGIVGVDGSAVGDPVVLEGDPPVATFRPGGRATAGFIYLIDDRDLERGDPTKMRAITITEATGRVRLWKYDANATGPIPWRLER